MQTGLPENITSEIAPVDEGSCISCRAAIGYGSVFCKFCGSSQALTVSESAESNWNRLRQAAVFYGLELTVCLTVEFWKSIQTLIGLAVAHMIMAVYGIYFIAANWQQSKIVLRWNNFSLAKLGMWMAAGSIGSVLINAMSRSVNETIFHHDFSYYLFFSGHQYGLLLYFVFLTILPPLFEELAYRGYLLQTLLKVMDRQQAIFITSFLFAMVHLSFISLIWLILSPC